jgi:hypothetical protein
MRMLMMVMMIIMMYCIGSEREGERGERERETESHMISLARGEWRVAE